MYCTRPGAVPWPPPVCGVVQLGFAAAPGQKAKFGGRLPLTPGAMTPAAAGPEKLNIVEICTTVAFGDATTEALPPTNAPVGIVSVAGPDPVANAKAAGLASMPPETGISSCAPRFCSQLPEIRKQRWVAPCHEDVEEIVNGPT